MADDESPYRPTVQKAVAGFMKDLSPPAGPDGKPPAYQLYTANALWGQQGYKFLDPFKGLLKAEYGAGFQQVDFVGATEAARKTINDWAFKETREKVPDLIPPKGVDTATRLVLTNAIYFKGTWADQFKKESTRDEKFHVSAGVDKTAAMMNRTGQYGYAEKEGLQVLRLPYAGGDLEMIVLLPKAVDGYEATEKALTPENLAAWTNGLQEQKVVVSLPKFKFATPSYEMKDILAKMGMADAFSPGAADFSGMDGKVHYLYIAHVFHKAFVDVNEEGTEAAAATAVVMAKGSAPSGARRPRFSGPTVRSSSSSGTRRAGRSSSWAA